MMVRQPRGMSTVNAPLEDLLTSGFVNFTCHGGTQTQLLG